MKFYKALLLLSATVSLALANGLDISENEVEGASGLDAGFGGDVSSTEIDQNVAPVEDEPVLPPTPPVPQTPPSLPPVPQDDTPVAPPSLTPEAPVEPPSLTPVEPPQTDTIDSPAAEDNISAPPTVETGSNNQESANISGQDQTPPGAVSENDDNEANDAINSVDTAPADDAGIENGDDGEYSDQYGDVAPVDALDSADVAGAEAEAEVGVNGGEISENDKDENENNNDDNGNAAKIAGGIAGCAFLSSAGIFLWVKKSKRSGLQSVRTQISMV